MGWKKILKKSLNYAFNPFAVVKDLGNVAKDFKDWYSGEDAAQNANERNIANWEMQNAYNTPSAQMARYKEAGLNPNLIYSQQNTAGAVASSPVAESGSAVLAGLGGLISSGFAMKAAAADIKNKNAQNSLLNSQADYVREQVIGQELENDIKRRTLESLGPGVNPNDPYWYRDFKRYGSGLLRVPADWLGRFVGSLSGPPEYTVRVNGKEFVGLSDRMAEDVLNSELKRSRREKGQYFKYK